MYAIQKHLQCQSTSLLIHQSSPILQSSFIKFPLFYVPICRLSSTMSSIKTLMKYIYYNLMKSYSQNRIHFSAISHQKKLCQPILLTSEITLNQLANQSIIETPNNIDNTHVDVPKKHIKTLLFCLVLIAIALSALLVMSAMFKNYQDLKQSGLSRNLKQIGSGQSRDSAIDVRSKDDVPRWFNYQSQESADLQVNPSRTFVPSLAQSKKDKFDAIGVIFQNNLNLNFEIAAGITGEKLKMASKLLSLNQQNNEYQKQIYDFERQYYQKLYNTSAYSELPICVIVPTYNNADNERYKQNLQSIMKQQYQNYKVINRFQFAGNSLEKRELKQDYLQLFLVNDQEFIFCYLSSRKAVNLGTTNLALTGLKGM